MRRTSALFSFLLLAGCNCSAGPGGDRGADAGPFGPIPDGGLVILGHGVPSDAPSRFASRIDDAARAVSILYPLDGAMLPRNLYSPDVQWTERGAAGDLFRVRYSGAGGSISAIIAHTGADFRYDYLLDQIVWGPMLGRSSGQSIEIAVDRWEAASNQAIAGPSVHVQIADGGIAGAVYYWALGDFGGTEGRILRVRQGTDAAPAIENFMPEPPEGTDGARCAACHGLARDGNRIAVALHDGSFGGVFDLTEDLSGPNPPMQFRFSQSWYFAAFNPDGTRLFMTDASQGSFLLDGTTGAPLPGGDSIGGATHPAWSPDGAQLALIGGADDAWDPTHGNLAVIPVTGVDTLGARSRLHTGSDLSGAPEGGELDAYPSYSPDSRFIAFQHGTRTLVTADGASAALYVIDRNGGDPVRLDRASEGGAWYPNYTPFTTPAAGAQIHWLLFYSPRDYGNSRAGTQGTGRRQIWVTAISTQPTAGGDPSFAPYWLPGQDTGAHNASAYWAPIPCRPTGQDCATSAQCCSNACGEFNTCEPPQACRREGETCTESADCCDPTLACAGGVCVDAPI